MATEVTKLISVSLGKMHQSRQTKCGLNLRRSLLVASVLHKARDAYVTEIKNRKVDSQRPSETAAPAPEPVRKRRFTTQRSMVDSTSDQNSNNNLDNNVNSNSVDIKSDTDSNESVKRVKRDAVSSTTASTQKESQSCAVADNVLDMLASESETESCDSQSNTNIDKENSPPSTGNDDSNKQDNNTVASSLLACGRCSLKRRYSQNDSSNGATTTTTDDYPSLEDSSNQDNNFSKQKRSKADTVSSPSDNNTSLVSAVNSTDTTQINDLVQMLRQSFPEFTPTDEDHHDSSILSSTSSVCDTTNTFSIREAIVLTA